MTYDAFVSYASPDLAIAEDVHRCLRSAGLNIWFDKARLNPGCNWHLEIESGCESSRVLLPILTPRWKRSEWTRFETYGAEHVIPIVVEGGFPEVFTPPLARFQAHKIDLQHSDDTAWKQLIDAVRTLTVQPLPDRNSRVRDVRRAANPHFVGREQELVQIHERLHANPTPDLTQGRVLAVSALGGVGKTTLVRHYLEKMWRCYPEVYWIDASLGVDLEFARLCDLLEPAQIANTNVSEKAQLALQELQKRVERLLVIDNVADERSIQDWLPKAGGCRTLITSRFAGWSAAIESFDLQVLERESSRNLLIARTRAPSFASLAESDQMACDELAQKLGFLPLALEQAAAYIAQQGPGFGFADYQRLYLEATRELLAAGSLGSTQYPDSVMTTWATTTLKLAPASRAILRLCSFLAPTPVPLVALIDGIAEVLAESGSVTGTSEPAPAHAEVWVRRQVQPLRDYSMVQSHENSIALHPLVQEVERLNLERDEKAYSGTLARALRLVDESFTQDPRIAKNWRLLDPLAPHAIAVAEHGAQHGLGIPVANLVRKLGEWFKSKNNLAEAEKQLRQVLELDRTYLGAGHTRVASDLSELSLVLAQVDRCQEAESLMLKAIAVEEASETPSGSKLATFHSNLAATLLRLERTSEAEQALNKALTIATQAYGGAHASAVIRHNLGALFTRTNRTEQAEQLFREAHQYWEDHRDPDHPDLADSFNCQALSLQMAGQTAKAEALYQRALSILESGRNLNEHVHYLTPVVRSNLALLYADTNRLTAARAMIRRAKEDLQSIERETGKTHQERPTVMHNFRHIYLQSCLHYAWYIVLVILFLVVARLVFRAWQ